MPTTVRPYDHRSSIVAYIDQQATSHREAGDRDTGTTMRALASTIAAGLDMERGQRGIASPVHAIAREVAAVTRISVAEILGRSQVAEIVQARFAVAWIASKRLGWAAGRIGTALDRDPTAVKHGIQRAEAIREQDAGFASMTDRLAVAEICCPSCKVTLVNP